MAPAHQLLVSPYSLVVIAPYTQKDLWLCILYQPTRMALFVVIYEFSYALTKHIEVWYPAPQSELTVLPKVCV